MSLSFSGRLEQVSIKASMGRTGSALDDVMSEGFVSTSKVELVSRLKFPSRRIVKTALLEYLGPYYDVRRLRSSLGHRSLADYEENRIREASVA
jgi:putative transposase